MKQLEVKNKTELRIIIGGLLLYFDNEFKVYKPTKHTIIFLERIFNIYFEYKPNNMFDKIDNNMLKERLTNYKNLVKK